MGLSFDLNDWTKSIQEEDFTTDAFEIAVEGADGDLESTGARGITYDLTGEPETDNAYEELMRQARHSSNPDLAMGEGGRLLAEAVHDASQADYEQWIENEKLSSESPGRCIGYEVLGEPYIRILDEIGDETYNALGSRPMNTVGHAKDHFQDDESYDAPEEFLTGMEAFLADRNYEN